MATQSLAISKPTWYRYFWLLVSLWLLVGAGAVALFVVKQNILGIALTSLVFCIVLQLAYWYSRMWVFREHRRQIRANLLARRANNSSLSYDPATDKPPNYEDILNIDPPPPSYHEIVNEYFTFPDLPPAYEPSSSLPSAESPSVKSGKETIRQSMKKRLGNPEPGQSTGNKPEIREPTNELDIINQALLKSNDNPRHQEERGNNSFANVPGNEALTIENNSNETYQRNDYDTQRHHDQKKQDSTANLPGNEDPAHITPIETSSASPAPYNAINKAHWIQSHNDQGYGEHVIDLVANVPRNDEQMHIALTRRSSVLPNIAVNKTCQNYDPNDHGHEAQRIHDVLNAPKNSILQRFEERRCQNVLTNPNGHSKLKSHDGQRCEDDLTNTHRNIKLQKCKGLRYKGDHPNTLENTEFTSDGASHSQITVISKSKGGLTSHCRMYNNNNDPLRTIRQPILGNVNRSVPLETC